MGRIEELEELTRKATPGPLHRLGGIVYKSDGTYIKTDADRDLEVAAVNSLPDFVALAKAVRALMRILPVNPTARIKWHADEVDAALAKLDNNGGGK